MASLDTPEGSAIRNLSGSQVESQGKKASSNHIREALNQAQKKP